MIYYTRPDTTSSSKCLETGAMDDLHVDGHLTPVVADNENADGATARLKSLLETGPEGGLINDREVLLDIASLGHGDDGTILHVKNAILLEDGAKHGLNNHAGGGVGDEAGLLMELLGEEVDAEVTVLAGGSGGRDADHLAGAVLENKDVSETNVVAGDGHGVGANIAAGGNARLGASLLDLDRAMDILIVVTHLGCLGGSVNGSVNGLFDESLGVPVKGRARSGNVDGGLCYLERLLVAGGKRARRVDSSTVVVDGLLEGRAVRRGVNGGTGDGELLTEVGLGAGTVLALSNVDDRVLRAMRVIVVDARLGVGGLRSVTLLTEVLLADTGTAVFTSDADLFFVDASLLAGREFDSCVERRVVTFPSGVRGGFDL